MSSGITRCSVVGAENELLVERQRLQQLQGDFEFNLGLLEQRDQELSHYDSTFAEVKRVVGALTAENSELKVTQHVCTPVNNLEEYTCPRKSMLV